MLCDASWNLVWVSTELRTLIGEEDEGKLGYGDHLIEAYLSDTWSSKTTVETQMQAFFEDFPCMMRDTPGGRSGLREIFRRAIATWPAPPEWASSAEPSEDAIDQLFDCLEPREPGLVWTRTMEFVRGDLPPAPISETVSQLRDAEGLIGWSFSYMPALPARVLDLVARGDETMYARMERLLNPGRRRAALLFADLQDSAGLSRSLPSAAYFALIRALTTAVDAVVVRFGGIVGKHAGDGVTAFFLEQDVGSPSAAARAALQAARAIDAVAAEVAVEVGEETGLIQPHVCRINVGLHWGGALYMGQLVTGGRLEPTALGDEVNQCARIQQSARGGQILVSKSLLEQLTDADAQAVAVDPDRLLYTTVAELQGATDKAVRDAGGVPVAAV